MNLGDQPKDRLMGRSFFGYDNESGALSLMLGAAHLPAFLYNCLLPASYPMRQSWKQLLLTLLIALLIISLFPDYGSAQKRDCGSAPLICVPMFGLSQVNSPERKALDKLYDKLVDSAGNDKSKLFNDRLATAVQEILSKADDQRVQFWILVINPSTQKSSAKFYIARGSGEDGFDSFEGLYINCPLDPSLCGPLDIANARSEFNRIWREVEGTGELQAELVVEVEPNSVVARGFSTGVPANVDQFMRYGVALLGRDASGRIKPDKRDLLRVGIVNGLGAAEDFGSVLRFKNGCALFATYIKYDKANECYEWSVETNSRCKGAIDFTHWQQSNFKENRRKVTDSITSGKPESYCGGSGIYRGAFFAE